MLSRKHSPRMPRRSGFTLIEMLVVLLILMMLAGLVMAFMPAISTKQQSERGGLILRTAINQTKQNARRDYRAAGIRLVPNGNFCFNPLFIQKPDDFGGYIGTGISSTVYGTGFTATLVGADLSNSPIAAGDSIEIGGSGLPHLIASTYSAGSTTLPLLSPLLNPLTSPGTSQYRVMRAPRLLTGESPVELPRNIAVDLTASGYFASGALASAPTLTLFGASYDILFAPSGQVLSGQTGSGQIAPFTGDAIVICLRDITSSPPQGFPVFVIIYGKTGFVTQQPVNPSGDIYLYVRQAVSSGM